MPKVHIFHNTPKGRIDATSHCDYLAEADAVILGMIRNAPDEQDEIKFSVPKTALIIMAEDHTQSFA